MPEQKIDYRKITPEEKLHLARLQGFVFSFDPNEKEIREKIEKGAYDSSNTYGAVDENGTLLAGMEVIPYTMWFDGQTVPMYGIGGVASVPEARRQGNIRKIFEKVFADIYEKGAVFSHLYPFSYDYYRRFGYEQCGAANRYTLLTAPARALPNTGTAHEFGKDSPVRNDLIAVYEAFAARHNTMLSRTEKRWDEVFDMPLFGPTRLYYWKDAAGAIKAWVKFAKKDETMEINDIAWTDHDSMLGILQFMGMFDGAAPKIALTASPELIPQLYWNDLYEIKTDSTAWLGMNRVINAQRALELMKKPDEAGAFTIAVTDGFAAWNNHTYRVQYDENACSVAEADGVQADIAVSERALMLLVLGVYPLEQIALRSDVQMSGNQALLAKVFPAKKLLIADYF